MLLLTRVSDDEEVSINKDHIALLSPHASHVETGSFYTKVSLSGGHFVDVSESIKYIMKEIKEGG